MFHNTAYETFTNKMLFFHTSVADPDPGSGAFLPPGSGIRIRDGAMVGSGSGIRDK
jgi:hypothetical protein